jgi:hypothetical protein
VLQGWGRVGHSPATPPCHIHGSRSCSMDLTGVRERAAGSAGLGAPSGRGRRGGEDIGRWCAAAGNEERGRGKDGEKEVLAK